MEKEKEPDMVCNPSPWEAKAGGFLRVGGQPKLHGGTLPHKQKKERHIAGAGQRVDLDFQLKMVFLPKISLKWPFLLKAKS